MLHIERILEFKFIGHIQLGVETYDPEKTIVFITVPFTDLNSCKTLLDEYYRSMLVKEMMKHAGKDIKK